MQICEVTVSLGRNMFNPICSKEIALALFSRPAAEAKQMSPVGSGSQQPADCCYCLALGRGCGWGWGGRLCLRAPLDPSRRKIIKQDFREDESHQVTKWWDKNERWRGWTCVAFITSCFFPRVQQFNFRIRSGQWKGQQRLGEAARGLSVSHCAPVIYLSKQISQALSDSGGKKGNGNDLFMPKINKNHLRRIALNATELFMGRRSGISKQDFFFSYHRSPVKKRNPKWFQQPLLEWAQNVHWANKDTANATDITGASRSGDHVKVLQRQMLSGCHTEQHLFFFRALGSLKSACCFLSKMVSSFWIHRLKFSKFAISLPSVWNETCNQWNTIISSSGLSLDWETTTLVYVLRGETKRSRVTSGIINHF